MGILDGIFQWHFPVAFSNSHQDKPARLPAATTLAFWLHLPLPLKTPPTYQLKFEFSLPLPCPFTLATFFSPLLLAHSPYPLNLSSVLILSTPWLRLIFRPPPLFHLSPFPTTVAPGHSPDRMSTSTSDTRPKEQEYRVSAPEP